MAALVRQHYDSYVTSLTPTTTAATTTSTTSATSSSATRPTTANAAAAAAVTDDDAGSDAADLAIGAGVVLVVVLAVVWVQRPASRRPSSWARSASGSVTGS